MSSKVRHIQAAMSLASSYRKATLPLQYLFALATFLCLLFLPYTELKAKNIVEENFPEGATHADSLSLMDNLWKVIGKSVGGDVIGKPQKLPLGVVKQINGATYVIALDSMRFTPMGAFIGAYAQLEIPGTNHPIAFAARNVGVGPNGINASQAKLMLASDERIRINSKTTMVLTKDGGNFVEWDCNGFKSIGLKGYIEFSPDMIVAADTKEDTLNDGTMPPQHIVKAGFSLHASSLHDLIFSVDMPDFKTKAGGAVFRVRGMFADFSDIENPTGVTFPEGYFTGLEGAEINLWRGFFADEIAVILPKEIESRNGRLTLSAKQLVIDDMGVSVKASAENIDGKLLSESWPITVETAHVEVLKNQLIGGGLSGMLKVPILGYDSLRYSAEVYDRNPGWDYSMSVITDQNKTYPMSALSATLTIAKGSSVKVEKKGGKFTASAVLNGVLNIENPTMAARELTFENLSLLSRAPYLTDGIISLSARKDNKVGKFPISLDYLKIDVNAGDPIINVGVAVNFMDEKSFSGRTDVTIFSKLGEENGHMKWKVGKVKVGTVAISCNMGSFALKGAVNFYDDDPVYGNGFAGSLDLSLTELLKDMQAEMAFGKVDDFRYWRASLQIPVTIPIPPVPTLCINSLKGGLAYKMTRYIKTPSFMDEGDSQPDKFIPSKDAGMTFMAGVGLSFGKSVVAAKLAFEVAFNSNNGLRYVLFDGDAAFLCLPEELMGKLKSVDVTKTDNAPKTPISVRMRVLFNNEESSFHASMKTYINLLNIVKGIGPNNLVGEAVIHFDPQDWYIYVGRPSQPFGLSVLGLASVQSYFMMGTKTENMPIPPPQVAEVITKLKMNFMESENSMSTGKGFGMGARFDVNFGFGQNRGFIYAFLNVGAGGDILLRNYGDAQCQGRTGTIGFDGWYASGQAYAYLVGKFGIRVRKKMFDILAVHMAALLQAKAFNPAWFAGAIAAKYRVLGGLVKGKAELAIVLGEECKIVTNGDELGIDIIGDIQPANGQKGVNVFTAPQVAFNVAMEEEFGMMNLLDEYEQYRARVDELSFLAPQGAIAGEVEWNGAKNVAVLNSHDVLPSTADVKVKVKVHIEKKVGTEGWKPFMDGKDVDYETKESTFTTDVAPDIIPKSNVKYEYPVDNQYNFLPKEYNQGYVQLVKGQAYLFDNANNEWSYAVKFTAPDKSELRAPIHYDNANRLVNFDLPQGFRNSTVYSMNFVRSAANAGGAIDKNLQTETRTIESENGTVEIAENKLAGTITNDVEKTIYNIGLRTSAYNTFTEKMNSMSGYYELQDVAVGYLWVFGARMDARESFDRFELRGNSGSFSSLVRAEAVPEGRWYSDFLLPVMYSLYQQGDASISLTRDVSTLGLVPTKSVMLFNERNNGYELDGTGIATGFAPQMQDRIYVEYRVSGTTFSDYMELKNKAVNRYIDRGLGSAPENARRLIEHRGYIDAYPGKYKVNISYTLPGINRTTSTKQYDIKF